MGTTASRSPNHALPASLTQALGIAEHYGFVSLDDYSRAACAAREGAAWSRRWPLRARTGEVRAPSHAPIAPSSENESVILSCLKNGVLVPASPPALLYQYRYERARRGSAHGGTLTLRLEAFGMKDALGEALLIRAASAILDEVDHSPLIVHINSVGDREIAVRFFRELSLYYRRYGASLAPCCRSRVESDITAILRCRNERCAEVRADAPKSIAYLNDAHRAHLKNVLEYIEGMDLPYGIDEGLVDTSVTFASTVFELRSVPDKADATPAQTYAFGGRYEGLARRAGLRGVLCGTALSLSLAPLSRVRETSGLHEVLKPRILFIQLGAEALRRGLVVLELLRRARIPVSQALGAHSLAEQVGRAERDEIPYTVIIGHREAIDGTAIVRDTLTRSQETIPVTMLPRYFKTATRVR